MTTTKETPVRVAPGEGGNASKHATQPIPSQLFRQSVGLSAGLPTDAEICASAQRLLNGEAISGESPVLLLAVINKLWCATSPIAPQSLRFWKMRNRSGAQLHEYFVESRGCAKRLGLISAVTSQARFRRRLVITTGAWLPAHKPDVWDNIVRCLLMVFVDQEVLDV